MIEDDEEGADNDVPGEEFCNIYHFYNLPGIFKVCIFAPVGSVKTFGSPGDIIDSAESIDVEQVEVGGWVEEEGEGAGQDFPEILDPAEEDAV